MSHYPEKKKENEPNELAIMMRSKKCSLKKGQKLRSAHQSKAKIK
jgi:hypothetical protein